jgi:hypothetical protein
VINLKRSGSAVDFELFRPELNAALLRGPGGGRAATVDPVLMFKILVIQATNNLSRRISYQ